MLAPGGMVTRTGVPPLPPHAVPRTTAATAMVRANFLTDASKRMLKEYCCGERIDIALSAACRPAHLAHGAQRRGRSVALVDQLDGQPCALVQSIGQCPHFL